MTGEQLGEVYELIAKQALELERAKRNVENLTFQFNECKEKLEKRAKSYVGAIRTPTQKGGTGDGRELKSQRGRKGKIRTLWIYDWYKRFSLRHSKLRSGGEEACITYRELVRLAAKTDVKFLEQAIKENEALKDISKLRNPQVIAYNVPNDAQETDVIKAACEQAKVDEGSMMVKFPLKGKETTHWVLEANPKTFPVLIGLKQLIVGWSMVKLV